MLNRNEIKSIIEALLFASADPLSPAELKKFLKQKNNEQPKDSEAEPVLQQNVEVESIESSPESLDTVLTEGSQEMNPSNSDDDPLAQLLKRQDELNEELSTGEIRQILEDLREEYVARDSCGFELIEVARGYQFRSKPAYALYIRNMFKVPKPRFSAPSLETLSIVAYQQPVTKIKIEEIRGVESGGVMKTLLEKDLIRIVGRSEEPGKPVLYGTTRKFLEVFGLASLGELPTLRDLAALDTVAVVNEDTVVDAENDDFSDTPTSVASDEGETLILTDEVTDDLLAELDSSMEQLKETEKRINDKPDESCGTDPTVLS